MIAAPFLPRDEVYPDGTSRMSVVIARILALSDREVAETIRTAYARFVDRHRDLDGVLDRNFEIVAAQVEGHQLDTARLSQDRRRLIGAYFTHEYSIEAAALGNPSIVAAPDQSGLAAGEQRFVMSLRAIGEGHRSSIEFRTGVVAADATVRLDQAAPYATTATRIPHEYDKSFFQTKLDDLSMWNDIEKRVFARLGERFTMSDLEAAIAALDADGVERSISGETTRVLHWLASSNYRTSFPTSIDVSERVLFPSGPTESHGMEDARFVRFVEDDGTATYFATYTAFDGRQILPRRIGGNYVALGRHDNVNNYLMVSSDIRVWRESTIIQEPERPWELMQLGNCGSPLETEAGWLVITHGVGPFRTYALGALLLDLDDPCRVIGHLREPLLMPIDAERDGYVPNVVYSCGSMIHAGHLVLPYGYGDVGASVATVRLDDLLSRLTTPAR